MPKASVLFVDDEQRVLDGIRRTMSACEGEWECLFATSVPQALDVLAERAVRVVVTDIAMPGMSGKDLITQMYDSYPDVVVLVLSGHWTQAVSRQQVGPAVRFLGKPTTPERLIAAIRDALGESVLTDLSVEREKPALISSSRPAGHDPSWVDVADED